MRLPRRLRSSACSFALLALASHTGCFLPTDDPSAYYLAAPLVPAGGPPASGRVEILLTANQRAFFVALEGLAPGADYVVTLDGEAFAALATDASGRAEGHLDFGSPARDPRGRRIAVTDAAGNDVLELAGGDDARFFEAEVAPLASFGPGAGQVQTTTLAGQRSFATTLHGAEPGRYDVVVNGTPVAPLDAPGGSGSAVVADPAFDPREAGIEIQQGGVGYFAGSGHARIEGIDWCAVRQAAQALPASATGTARATLATRADCSRRLEVHVEGVPMDLYEVRIGGAMRATIAVGEDENGVTLGSVLFAPGEVGSAPLDFDPIDQPIEVLRAGETWFSLAAFRP